MSFAHEAGLLLFFFFFGRKTRIENNIQFVYDE